MVTYGSSWHAWCIEIDDEFMNMTYYLKVEKYFRLFYLPAECPFWTKKTKKTIDTISSQH